MTTSTHLIKKITPWALVFFLAILVGRDLRFGLQVLAVGAGVGVILWILQANKESVIKIVLAIVLWLGFFHEPITTGATVFWVQDALILGILVARIFRSDRTESLNTMLILVPLVIFAALTLPGSLATDSPFVYLNGLRRIAVAPLMFILGQLLSAEQSGQTVFNMLVWTFFLQLPASITVSALRSGSLFDIWGPDLLTGTFGRGGSGYIVIFGAAVLSIFVWRFTSRRISLLIFALAAGCFLLLGALSDLKFLYILLPICALIAFFMGFARIGRRLRIGSILAGFIGMFILLGALGLVVSESSSRWHAGTLSLYNVFNKDYLSEILLVDSGGIYVNKAGVPKFSRYGALVFAWDSVSSDFLRFLGGYGLGSTSEGSLGIPILLQTGGVENLNSSALSLLLIESGMIGTFVYLMPLFIIVIQAARTFRRNRGKDTNLEFSSGMLLLYGIALSASLPYTGFALVSRGGGVFWLLGGMLFAERAQMGQKTDGSGYQGQGA